MPAAFSDPWSHLRAEGGSEHSSTEREGPLSIAVIIFLPDVALVRRDKDRWSPPSWASSNRHAETLLDDLQLLLGDLCREWGICGAVADDVLPESGVITADNFANAVLIAEGWPEDDLPLQWQETMRKVFEARYGTSVSTSAYEQRFRG